MATTNTKTTVKTAEAEVKKTATKTTPVKTESKPAAKAVENKDKGSKEDNCCKDYQKTGSQKRNRSESGCFCTVWRQRVLRRGDYE